MLKEEHLPFGLAGRRGWSMAVGALFMFAALVALIGNVALPLEDHEVLVVQTAQEMHARQDWIVPYFNAEPRLNKPPLSYWLTGLTAWLAGSGDHVQPWHGRTPSILAGFGLVAVTLWLGRMLFDRMTALIAGYLLVASAGFYTFTHNARPDLLYAFWCALGYACFVSAWHYQERERISLAAISGMWVAYALAILTKGPQLPAMLLVACLLFCASQRFGWRQTLRLIRPLSGLALCALLTLPWWLAVHARVGAEALRGSQLSGSLFKADWRGFTSLYYFYRPLQLILPWLVLLPPVALLFKRDRRTPAVVLLGLLLLIPALALNAGLQKRWFYMLPLLPCLSLLLAAGLVHLSNRISRQARERWRRGFVVTHAAIVVGALGWGLTTDRLMDGEGVWLVAALGVVVLLAYMTRRQYSCLFTDIVAVPLMFGVAITALGATPLLWGERRFEQARLATVARNFRPELAIASWGLNPIAYVYYVGRPVPWLKSSEAVRLALEKTPRQELLVLMRTHDMNVLPSNWQIEVIDQLPGDRHDATSLVRIRRLAGPEPRDGPKL